MKLKTRYALIMLILVLSVVMVVTGTAWQPIHTTMRRMTSAGADSLDPILREQMQRRGEILTRFLAENLIDPLYQLDMDAIYQLLVAASEQKDVIHAHVYDPQGTVVHDGLEEMPTFGMKMEGVTKEILASKGFIAVEQTENIDFFMPIHIGEKPLGGVHISFSLKRIHTQIKEMRERLYTIEEEGEDHVLSTLVPILLLLLFVGFVVALWVANNLSNPINLLTKKAKALGQGDLESEIVLNRKDELETLASTLDVMRRNLSHSLNEIRLQNEELKQLDQLKDDFLANTTHELKTPLNGILGLGNALQDGAYGTLPEPFQKPLGQILFSAQRLLNMAMQILSISPGKQKNAEKESLFLKNHLQGFLIPFETMTAEKGVNLELNVADDLEVETDPQHLDTILMNLVGNAVKFTHKGYVRISAQMLEERIFLLSVEDTGIGIPEAYHQKIFERFQQGFASESRAYEGTGLGLAILKQSLEILGGIIQLQSIPNEGSQFSIALPLQPDVSESALELGLQQFSKEKPQHLQSKPEERLLPQPEKPQAEKPQPEDISETNLSQTEDSLLHAAILVVDDDAINREVVCAHLRHQFQVTEAENGQLCLDQLKKQNFDILLLDLMMPGVSGFDVLQTLMDQPGEKTSPPIIVLSARDQPSAISRAFSLGAVDYVTKPFHKEELLARIRAHVTLKRNAQELVEHARSEAKLHEEKAVAEASNQAKSAFLANMSHEIRTPMNAIIGLSHLTLQSELTDKQRDYISKIQTSGHLLLGIINDILDFSKIEAGKMNMESISFNLDEVLNNLSGMLNIKIEEKGLELLFSRNPEVPDFLVGDPLRLGQVLINLANNAIKFTESGEVELSVVVLETVEDTIRLQFSLRDSGIGMTEEQAARLFQPFSQADSTITRKYGGTGLGLTICKRIVEMMSGRIWVESRPGEGSVFHFIAQFGLSSEQKPSVQTTPTTLHNMPVLVVDDNETARHIMQTMLEGFTFKPTLAASGEEALQLLRRAEEDNTPFKLVLMDWRMPGMNGIETSQIILEGKNPPKIIMLTAFGREDVLHQVETLGLDGILIKPANPSLLFDSIMQICGQNSAVKTNKTEKSSGDKESLKKIAGARLLLVEDNKINQQVAGEILKNAGFWVDLAENGQEAVDKVETTSFDGVLMDLQMPVLDGYSASKQIRNNPKNKALPIIAMTAHAMNDDREKCLQAGMNGHVAKPIDPTKLFATLVKWIKPGVHMAPQVPIPTEKTDDQHTTPLTEETLPGLNLESGLKRLGGNKVLYQTLLNDFYRDFSDVGEKIARSLQGNRQTDPDTTQQLVHAVKGVSGNLGATTLYEAAIALEKALKSNDETVWPTPLSSFKQALGQVLQTIATLNEATLNEKTKENPPSSKTSDSEDSTTIPLEEIHPELDKLLKLLEANDPKAIEQLSQIKGLLGTLPKALEEVEDAIDIFDFDTARNILHTMMMTLK